MILHPTEPEALEEAENMSDMLPPKHAEAKCCVQTADCKGKSGEGAERNEVSESTNSSYWSAGAQVNLPIMLGTPLDEFCFI